MASLEQNLPEVIMRAIREEIDKVANEEIDAAVERIHARVKGRINELAVRVLDNFSIERQVRDLIIRVQHQGQHP